MTESEPWITELQELYNEAAAVQAQYMNEQIQIEKKQREEINRQEGIRMEQERFQKFDGANKQEKEINGNNLTKTCTKSHGITK